MNESYWKQLVEDPQALQILELAYRQHLKVPRIKRHNC